MGPQKLASSTTVLQAASKGHFSGPNHVRGGVRPGKMLREQELARLQASSLCQDQPALITVRLDASMLLTEGPLASRPTVALPSVQMPFLGSGILTPPCRSRTDRGANRICTAVFFSLSSLVSCALLFLLHRPPSEAQDSPSELLHPPSHSLNRHPPFPVIVASQHAFPGRPLLCHSRLSDRHPVFTRPHPPRSGQPQCRRAFFQAEACDEGSDCSSGEGPSGTDENHEAPGQPCPTSL